MTKETKKIILGSLVLTTGLILGYRAIKRKQVYDGLVTKIKSGSLTSENIAVNKAMRGSYHTSLNTEKAFVKLKDVFVKDKAEKLRNAFFGTTDEDSIYAVLNSLNDKVALSQIASFYSARYNESFYDRLNDELNDAEMTKAYKIMSLKPDVRWLN